MSVFIIIIFCELYIIPWTALAQNLFFLVVIILVQCTPLVVGLWMVSHDNTYITLLVQLYIHVFQ